jgi:hypothetical protein
VSTLTEAGAFLSFNRYMVSSLIVAGALLGGAATALRGGRNRGLITHRPYNNRHSDATAARDERARMLD